MNYKEKKDHMCFACSPKNPIGLKMEFEQVEDKVISYFEPGEEHQGYNGYMHGGLISTLLDETMAQWLWLNNIPCMTAEITSRYSRAVPIGQKLKIESYCVSNRRGKLYEMEASIILPDGNTAVKAKAKFMPVELSELEKQTTGKETSI